MRMRNLGKSQEHFRNSKDLPGILEEARKFAGDLENSREMSRSRFWEAIYEENFNGSLDTKSGGPPAAFVQARVGFRS